MKKVLASLVSLGLLVGPAIVLAQPPVGAPDWGTVDFWDALDNIFNYLFWILIVIAAIAIVIAAYFFVTAAGDPDKTKKARDFVLYALIGVLVAFLAKALIYLIEEIVM